MNFFEHQRKAKSNTLWLLLLLTLAVTSLIVITTLVFTIAFHYSDFSNLSGSEMQGGMLKQILQLVDTPLTYLTATGIVIVIACASLLELSHLSRGGGAYVAESVGGRLIISDTTDRNEKKVLNIVEEMSIASGNTVPSVYLLPEAGINAFAAGNNKHDSVIGVTQGAIDALNRDELQGVIAHEFSHIHNGDTKINMRLVAVIYGLVIISEFGQRILYYSFGLGSSRKREDSINPIFVLGIALTVIGFLGSVFARMIKAAVSRQREYLADASAVQFTRNPDGIGQALMKIGGFANSSTITHPCAEKYSHMYFGTRHKVSFSSIFATHPPLKDRITRVLPQWNKQFIYNASVQSSTESTLNQGFISNAAVAGLANESQAGFEPTANETQTHSNQAPVADKLTAPQSDLTTLTQLPDAFYRAVHHPYSARALIYYSLLTSNKKTRREQLALIAANAHPKTAQYIGQLIDKNTHITHAQKLVLVELALPALRQQSDTQLSVFLKNTASITEQAFDISVFNWCLYQIIDQSFSKSKNQEKYSIVKQRGYIAYLFELVARQLSIIDKPKLSIMKDEKLKADIGTPQVDTDELMAIAWRACGCEPYSLKQDKTFKLSINNTHKAFTALKQLRPLDKPKLIRAIKQMILADGVITDNEDVFYRALCLALDCYAPRLQE